MSIELSIGNLNPTPDPGRTEAIQKKQAAEDFEEIFARHLVREMTKDSFEMSASDMGGGTSNHIYREFITDALASELAAQRQLGMADLVEEYWNRTSGTPEQDK